MNALLNSVFRVLHSSLLRAASLLLPVGRREEWLREWRAELWHARDTLIAERPFSWWVQYEITAFCLGSFSDALCLRQQFHQSGRNGVSVHSSAMQCLLRLFVTCALCAMVARFLPGVSAEYDMARYPIRSNLILIQGADASGNTKPVVRYAQFQDWQSSHQRSFDELAFYRSAVKVVSLSKTRKVTLEVAVASSNLISMLGLPVATSSEFADEHDGFPKAILSYETWIRAFGSDPHVAGRLIRVGAHTARVVGVLPCGSWQVPENPGIWMLEPASKTKSLIGDGPGYVLAHLTSPGRAEMISDTMPVLVRGSGDNTPQLCGVLLSDRAADSWHIYLFALALALLALPAVVSVSISESNFSSHRPSWKQRTTRWLFLAVKLALVASIAYFASLDIAFWKIDTYSETAELVQLAANFSICLFGFRWALMDQSQRCPVCLRRVTHPAHVGLASQTFLGWNGTEMMCAGGHTLLHVPSIPTSWFGAQRWLYLDTSWEFLFADLSS